MTYKHMCTASFALTTIVKLIKMGFILPIPMPWIQLLSIKSIAMTTMITVTRMMFSFLPKLVVHLEGQRKGGFEEGLRAETKFGGFGMV